MTDLRQSFRPEFLNRVDDTVLFKPLTVEETTRIVDLLVADLNTRLADRRVVIALTEKARAWVGERGYDPIYGARPLKRFIQKEVENRLARALIGGEILEGAEVTFGLDQDALTMSIDLSAEKSESPEEAS